MFYWYNKLSMTNLINLCMFNILDHIIDNYINHCNNLKYKFRNRFRDSSCNRDRYHYSNNSNMKYYFNFGKLNMFNHMANNNYFFDNNHHHITKNKFTIFNCNQDMNHLSNNSCMINLMNLCMYNMIGHIIDNYIKYCNIPYYNLFDNYLGQQYNKDTK